MQDMRLYRYGSVGILAVSIVWLSLHLCFVQFDTESKAYGEYAPAHEIAARVPSAVGLWLRMRERIPWDYVDSAMYGLAVICAFLLWRHHRHALVYVFVRVVLAALLAYGTLDVVSYAVLSQNESVLEEAALGWMAETGTTATTSLVYVWMPETAVTYCGRFFPVILLVGLELAAWRTPICNRVDRRAR